MQIVGHAAASPACTLSQTTSHDMVQLADSSTGNAITVLPLTQVMTYLYELLHVNIAISAAVRQGLAVDDQHCTYNNTYCNM